MHRPLPARTLLALRAIYDYRARYAEAPTVRELSALTGIKSTSHVSSLLKVMRRRGLIKVREVGRTRQARFTSTQVTSKGLLLLGEPTEDETGT